MIEPEAGATASVELIVGESDCANAIRLTSDPRDVDFPAVFATTRVIAHDPGGEIGRGTHKRAIILKDRLAGAARRQKHD